MKRYLIHILFSACLSVSGQEDPIETLKIVKEQEPPLAFAETSPEFPGGFVAMARFVSQNIQFPSSIDYPICLTVYVSFVVNTDGSLSDIKIIRCSPECQPCCEEAIRVIKQMPKWKPGFSNGKPVAVRFAIPMRFSLK